MYVALGEEALAAKLIAASRDKAGVDLAEVIVRYELKRYQLYLESVGKMTKALKDMILGTVEAQHGNEFVSGVSGTRNLGYAAAFRRMCQSREFSFEAANPRHEHEWEDLKQTRIP